VELSADHRRFGRTIRLPKAATAIVAVPASQEVLGSGTTSSVNVPVRSV
jgi:hypothetical protein